MPLKRTPPKGAHSDAGDAFDKTLSIESLPASGSAPDLSTIGQDNIRKRKHDDISCIKSFMEEIRNMLDKSAEQNNKKFLSIESKMTEIISQNNNIVTSIEFVSKKYDELQSQMQEAANERKTDRLYIRQLESRIETLERTLYSTRLELKNVPKKENEVKDDLCDVIIKTGSVLGVQVQQQEIKEVFRTRSKSDKPGTVVVDFVSAVKRDKIIKKTREYNRKNSSNKFNTKLLSFDGPEKPIFISESLSPRGHQLFRLARDFAAENSYKFCWISYGKIYLRRDSNERFILVDSEDALSKLRLEK
ncbi:uncharacterized protein LOC114358539 [Ostrinia furnacalis]|uniref:uncharacterized protein LOC114358539 n=1 Tax=Ostrinia furnacalis TaxID=93504 RepID=UPI00103E8942|nr:uncharacterized protein LOC114358539 [Ostrinia furnacalis]